MYSEIFSDDIARCVLSNPLGQYEKIAIRRLNNGWQAEKFKNNQVFHEHIAKADLAVYVTAQMPHFRQLNAWGKVEHQVRVNKNGTAKYTTQPLSSAPQASLEHNREKCYLLPPGAIIPPLIDMGVMTQSGKVKADMQHKFRQINRFLEIVDNELKKLGTRRTITMLDLCCGKSYLTFIMYHYLVNIKGLTVDMLGIDQKTDVIAKCNATAQKYGYDGLKFMVGDINKYDRQSPPDVVIALHACDTATDYVLYNAIRWQARLIFSVPCCQHELNAQLKGDGLLTKYGIIKERFAALTTDAIRAGLLEYSGYRTQILEFVDLEHTPKNLLIRAVNTHRAPDPAVLTRIESLMAQYGVRPTLYTLLNP